MLRRQLHPSTIYLSCGYEFG